MPQMTIEWEFPILIFKKDGWWIASSPHLDLHSQGKTKKEAKINFEDALGVFLQSCLKRQTIDAVLKECGITPATTAEPDEPSPKYEKVKAAIPFNLGTHEAAGCPA